MGGKWLILLVGVLVVPKECFAMKRALVSQTFEEEDKALDYILKHSIPVMSLEAPEDKELFKKKLRFWNPQIEDWTKVGGWEEIKVYRKSPIYEVGLGYHAYQNEEGLSEGGVLKTTNSGPTVNIKATFVHSLDWTTFINYHFLQKNDFTVVGKTRLYKFPSNNSVELGVKYQSPFSAFSYEFALGYEEYSFISFNNERFRIRTIIEDNLQVSTTKMYWLFPAIDYRFTLMGRGSYLRVGVGRSFMGDKSLDDGEKFEEVVDSTRLLVSWKQYYMSRFFVRFYYQYARMEGLTKTDQTQFGLYTGYSF